MKKILLCTDGSAYSEVCCRYAAWLAKRSSAGIAAFYLTDVRQFEIPFVADLSGSLGVQPYRDMITQLQHVEKQKAAAIEEITRKTFRDCGLAENFGFEHRTGLLVDQLEELEQDADLVMLGKRGENAEFAAEHLGSTMERVIRASAKPCFVTSRAYREIRKMVVAHDGGPSCQKAMSFLATHAADFQDIALHIVSVAEEKDEQKTREDQIEQAASKARESGYEPVTKVLGGAVEDAIAKYVEENAMDLLMMGAYGHNRIRYLLIGSTTTAVIRSCHIPVLSFR